MQKYIITQEYFNQYADILTGSDFQVGTLCTQDEDGTLHLLDEIGLTESLESADSADSDGNPDPILPPRNPPILP